MNIADNGLSNALLGDQDYQKESALTGDIVPMKQIANSFKH